jgi:type II secretion system protein J
MNLRNSNPQFQGGRPSASGFTLLEIIIAIAIFSMVMVAIYATWAAVLRGSKAGIDAAADAQRSRMTMRAVTEALGSAQLYVDNMAHYAFYSEEEGDFSSISFIARLSETFPGSGLFSGQPIRRVSFSVEPVGGRHNQLVLRQSPLLEPQEITEPYAIVLAPHVNLFSLEFFDTNLNEWASEWTLTNQLPRMVRVAVGLGSPGRNLSREEISVQTVLLSSVALPREALAPARARIGGSRPPTPTPPGDQSQ